jgi:hypothetical protein
MLNTPDPSYHGAVWTQAVKPLGPMAYIIKARVTLLREQSVRRMVRQPRSRQCQASQLEHMKLRTSAGQIAPAGAPPYFVIIERALRDEDTSYHSLRRPNTLIPIQPQCELPPKRGCHLRLSLTQLWAPVGPQTHRFGRRKKP